MASISSSIAPEYSSTKEYRYGDYCMHNNTLYRYTNPVNTTGEFNQIDWTKTSLFNLVQGKYELDNTNNLAAPYEEGVVYSEKDVVEVKGMLYICKVSTSSTTWVNDEWEETSLMDLTQYNSELIVSKSPVLLWENSSPTTAFAAQTISVDLSKYRGIIVEFRESTSDTGLYSRLYIKKGEDLGAGYFGSVNTNSRKITSVTDTGVTISDNKQNGVSTTNNTILIPYRIYGVETVISEAETAIDDAPVLLWTNPSPTTAFPAQNISLDLSSYEGVIVEAFYNYNDNRMISRGYIKIDESLGLGINSESWGASRAISVSIDGVSVKECYQKGEALSGSSVIPFKIYGVKNAVVEVETNAPVLLWANTGVTAEFDAQTIPLDLSEYTSVLVEFNETQNLKNVKSRVYAKIGETAGCGMKTDQTYCRSMTVNTDGITFTTAYYGSTENVYALYPTKIYGIKEVIMDVDTNYTGTCEPISDYLVEKGAEASEVATVDDIKTYLESNLSGFPYKEVGIMGAGSSYYHNFIIKSNGTILTDSQNGEYFTLGYEKTSQSGDYNVQMVTILKEGDYVVYSDGALKGTFHYTVGAKVQLGAQAIPWTPSGAICAL